MKQDTKDTLGGIVVAAALVGSVVGTFKALGPIPTPQQTRETVANKTAIAFGWGGKLTLKIAGKETTYRGHKVPNGDFMALGTQDEEGVIRPLDAPTIFPAHVVEANAPK